MAHLFIWSQKDVDKNIEKMGEKADSVLELIGVK